MDDFGHAAAASRHAENASSASDGDDPAALVGLAQAEALLALAPAIDRLAGVLTERNPPPLPPVQGKAYQVSEVRRQQYESRASVRSAICGSRRRASRWGPGSQAAAGPGRSAGLFALAGGADDPVAGVSRRDLGPVGGDLPARRCPEGAGVGQRGRGRVLAQGPAPPGPTEFRPLNAAA